MKHLLPARNGLTMVLFLTLSLPLLAHAQETIHIVDAGTTSKTPVSPAEMNNRIRDSAIEYREYAPIPRILFYDMVSPANAQEYAELGGNAILLITALSQDRTELPLKRVFVSLGGKEIELKLISSVLSQQNDAKSQTVKTFGPFRVDALYLLPAYLRLEDADLLADFAKNRTGFKLATFSASESPSTDYPVIKPSTEKAPSEAALTRIIRREYPGFIKN